MNNIKKLMIIGGGTGGHILPGIEIAKYLKNKGWKIYWIGTTRKMEYLLIPKEKIKFKSIEISGLRGKGIKNFFCNFIKIFEAILKSKKIINKYQPDIILSMGGYISGPGSIAGWISNIPIILHEQNTIAGLTNRFLSLFAKLVLQAFPNTFKDAQTVGNPISKKILNIEVPQKRFKHRNKIIRILILGGSQGSQTINRIIPKIASELDKKILILHQTGKGLKKETKKIYDQLNNKLKNYKLIEFIKNISQAYNWADVVISRSGALTVTEIATIGLPAIFIPFEHKDQQQYKNALILKKIGSAIIIKEKNLTPQKIIKILKSWNREDLLKMAKRSKNIAIRNSTEKISSILIDIVKNK
ncbi:MAG: undecaprenyldiphospho-muramoylpentapeptide beta-N-acetylglucosaminyltransferase [Arsenophonus sp.]|nr:MAG: undecaprenyldiphospho-muramoylpentapeptide beta-N-acetylglucosaminyltransferase [Arsenophonus sp.]